MMTRDVPYLALELFLYISVGTAAPPIILPSSATSVTQGLSLISPLSDGINTTRQTTLPSEFKSFPPGPPPSPLDYDIPHSDVTIELSTLGFIRSRDESVVEKVLSEATQASLNPYRPQEPIPEDGYQSQEGRFLLGVTPTAEAIGEERLTWGRWTDALAGMQGYVQAYPGYDFSFDIWVTPEIGHSAGYVVGTGFAMTRRR